MSRAHPLTEFRLCRRPRITLEQMAAKVGSTSGSLSRIENGLLEPPLWLALRLNKYTKIPLKAFVRPEKRT